MDLIAIRAGLKIALEPLGLQVYSRAVLNPDPPAAIIYPQPFGPDDTYDGTTQLRLVVLLLAPGGDFEGGQDMLDGWVSTTGVNSIKQQLDADLTLGASVSSAMWAGITEYGHMNLTDGGTVYLAARALVDVLA